MAKESSTPPSPTTTVPKTPVTLPPPDQGNTGQDGTGEDQPLEQDYFQKKFDEAFVYLKNLPLKQRLETLEMLRKKGFSSGSSVSVTGLDPTDVVRVRDLLVYQDSLKNVTSTQLLSSTLDQVKNWSNKATTGTGTSRTPDADLDAYLTSVMQARLGRSPRASELEKFRKAYGAMEAGGNEPTATVAAQEQIETANKGEYEASQFASFASAFESMLRSA